jgi:uncharacterized protein YjbJ (UPF0337 family)
MPNQDQTEGKLKEVGGKVTGDDRLESEGKTQKAKGDTAEKLDDAKESVKGAGQAVKDAVTGDGKR